MKKRAASQSEFKIADTPDDLRHLPLIKVRHLRDSLVRELSEKLSTEVVGRKEAEDYLNEVCLCTPAAQEAYARLLDASSPCLRKQIRTLRTLAQFAATLERRACQRPTSQAA